MGGNSDLMRFAIIGLGSYFLGRRSTKAEISNAKLQGLLEGGPIGKKSILDDLLASGHITKDIYDQYREEK